METNKILKYSIYLIISFISLNVFCQTSESNKKRFKDFYNFTEVGKAEVSLFKEDNYKSVDEYEKLIELMQCSKVIIAKFIPKTEVVFYNSSNSSTYNVYFSETFKYFKIEGRTFVISKKKSKEISKILSK
ncbi:MAG TPA: hypothetical protein VK021_02585 [Flavobacteriaceae bacterium]|nr:hypothetical protein [Flavobacteriaceae bacterium]